MEVGQKLKCGHHKGVVVEVTDFEAIADWGPPQKCMCARKPGVHLRRASNGSWWAEAVRHYWHSDDHLEVISLERGIQCELI